MLSPRPLWIAPVFVGAWILSSTCLALPLLGGGAWLAITTAGVPATEAGATAAVELLGAGPLAALTAMQFAVMLLTAVVLAMLLPPAAGQRSVAGRLADSFPLHLRRWGYVVGALVLGATAGALPSWAVEQLAALTGWEMQISRVINDLSDAPALARYGMYAVVAIVAPIVEEMVFRGFLWAAVERSAPPVVAWVVTSLMFAGIHIDPLQVLAVLPLAAVLGWLRWRTGSLWAPMAVHFVNNALALVLTLWPTELFSGLVASLVSAVVALAVLAVGWRLERPAA